jgi:hypothetical protein
MPSSARLRTPQSTHACTPARARRDRIGKTGPWPSPRTPPRPPSPVLAAPSPHRHRAGLAMSPSPGARRVAEYLASCRTSGQERTGPTPSASLAAAHGVEPCAAVAPPRRPSRARAEAPARFAQTPRRTPCTPISTSRRRTHERETLARRRAAPPPRPRRRPTRTPYAGRPSGLLAPTRGARIGAPCRPATQASRAITAGETPRAAALFLLGHFVEHRAGGLVVAREGGSAWTHMSPHARVAAKRSSGSGAARHLETRPHGGLHRSPPHRLPPDRLRLASGWPSRSADHEEPRPQLGSGDPVRPAVKEGFSFI